MRPLPATRWSPGGPGELPAPGLCPRASRQGPGCQAARSNPHPQKLAHPQKALTERSAASARWTFDPPSRASIDPPPSRFRGVANGGYRPVYAVCRPEIHTPHLGRLASPPMGQAATGGQARPEQPLTGPLQEDSHQSAADTRVYYNPLGPPITVRILRSWRPLSHHARKDPPILASCSGLPPHFGTPKRHRVQVSSGTGDSQNGGDSGDTCG